jgi:cytochrome c5
MKTGEKRAFMAILIAFVGVIIITVYYEILYQKREAEKQTAAATADEKTSMAKNPGIWVIPKGLNPDALPESQSRGATMLTLYCVQCHDLPSPTMHTAAEWAQVVDRMEKEMQRRRGGVLIRVMMPPEKDWKILRSYLENHAQKPLDTTQYADLDTPAGQAFQSTCSQCHAAPDPAQHTANEWARVVLRMKNNINAAGLEMPDEKTVELINNFLKAHSKNAQSATL